MQLMQLSLGFFYCLAFSKQGGNGGESLFACLIVCVGRSTGYLGITTIIATNTFLGQKRVYFLGSELVGTG